MSNALKVLFADIAKSIRTGLGTTERMSPMDFPKKIDEIVDAKNNSGVKIAAGNFGVPDAHQLCAIEVTPGSGFRENARGYIALKVSPALCKLEPGVTYKVSYRGWASAATAYYQHSFSTYGECVILGNKCLDGFSYDLSDPERSNEEFLMIYKEAEDSTTIICSKPFWFDDNLDTVSEYIRVFDVRPSCVPIVVEHGHSDKPDFVLIAPVVVASYVNGVISMWSIRYSLRHLMPNNFVLGASGSNFGLSSASEDQALDAETNSPIYCPDKKSFCIGRASSPVNLVPGAHYIWVALWGIDNIYGQELSGE